MTTYQTTFLSKPEGDDAIPTDVLEYVKAHNRQQAYNLIVRSLKQSGISQATLSRRLEKGTDVVSRLLSRPRNWEQDTLSELLFAICGGVISYKITYPNVNHGSLLQSGGGNKSTNVDAEPDKAASKPKSTVATDEAAGLEAIRMAA